ncbi:MAG: hypothetical protein IPI35_11625 [Deltaproteobacteria bacterium]|nr:hypothetical protein [Deltaproteobacteria bacterium]
MFLVVLACSNPDDTYTTAPGNYAEVPARELLAEWMAWRDISRRELLRRLTVHRILGRTGRWLRAHGGPRPHQRA